MRQLSSIGQAIQDVPSYAANKDFGKAFYLSTDEEQAKEMASFKADFLGGVPKAVDKLEKL